jgi:hypothetical protein
MKSSAVVILSVAEVVQLQDRDLARGSGTSPAA